MKLMTLCAAAVLSAFAVIGGAYADAREDLAKEVHEEVSKRHITCVITEYFGTNACSSFRKLKEGLCDETTEALADFKSELLNADTQKRAVYRWWKFVSGAQEQADCMSKLISSETYCKAVNLVAKFDPRRNCPSDGTLNSTCWLNPNKRDWTLLPSEQSDWTQRCPVERVEVEDEE